MNKQCHKCKKPVPDGEYKTIGDFIACNDCAPLVSKAELVRSIIGVSYAHDEQMRAVKIVEELEAENERMRGIIIDLELWKYEASDAVAHWDSVVHF